MSIKKDIDLEIKAFVELCSEFSRKTDSFEEIKKFQGVELKKLSLKAQQALKKASESFSKKVASQIGD